MKLADRLKKCLQEVQEGTTSSEFVMWKVLMEEDLYSNHKQDYYLAQIACEIRRVLAKKPNTIKLESFLLKFRNKTAQDKQELTPELNEEEKQKKTLVAAAIQKARWFGILGMRGKK